MREAAISVSLHKGTARKIFAAEVLNPRGGPLKNVEVAFCLRGDGSLAANSPVSQLGSRTDELGRASISFNRLEGQEGYLGARLEARCSAEVDQIRLLLVAQTVESP